MNLVMIESGRIVELQATAEGVPFEPEDLTRMYAMAAMGARQLIGLQHEALAAAGGAGGDE